MKTLLTTLQTVWMQNMIFIKTHILASLYRKFFWIAPTPKQASLIKYFDLIKQSLSNFANKHRFLGSKPNIPPKERQSLSEVKNTPHLVIKKAEKGDSIVS